MPHHEPPSRPHRVPGLHPACARALLALATLLPAAPQAAAQASEGVAQVGNLLGNIFGAAASAVAGAASAVAGKAAPAPVAPAAPAAAPGGPPAIAGAGKAPPAAAAFSVNAAALNELRVDKQCERVEERFDVWEKLAEYGGLNAQLRLQALVASDYQHGDLTEADRRMLKYLAYTTIWVPAKLETAVGKAWTALSDQGDDSRAYRSGRTQRKALARLKERLEALRSGIDGFPGAVSLLLDPDLADGAFARVGGLVVLSPRFLNQMDEIDPVRDVVFGHELAHLYKRHTMKELQYQLISSAAGWQLGKKLLARFVPKAQSAVGFGFIGEALEMTQLSAQLLDFVRNTQLSYSREQELEADACALRWLVQWDIDARSAWQAFAGVLAFSPERSDGSTSYTSLHPSPDERTRNIEQATKGARAKGAGAK